MWRGKGVDQAALLPGGHLKPDIYNGISTLADEYGVEAAAEVAAFEMENLQSVQSFVDRENIECDFEVSHAIDVQLDDVHYAEHQAGLESLMTGGSEISKHVEMNTGHRAEAVSFCCL